MWYGSLQYCCVPALLVPLPSFFISFLLQILVRKSFADREKRRKKRFWKLKRLAKEYDEGTLKQADKDEFCDKPKQVAHQSHRLWGIS